MLVLTRKHGQKIVIGGNIELTVSAIGRDRVKLAINAPADVAVHREEIMHRIERERACFEPALIG